MTMYTTQKMTQRLEMYYKNLYPAKSNLYLDCYMIQTESKIHNTVYIIEVSFVFVEFDLI